MFPSPIEILATPLESRNILRGKIFDATFFPYFSLRGSFFACNNFAFKQIYEGFEGVPSCKYFYLVVCNLLLNTFEGSFTVFTNYTKKITQRRKLLQESFSEQNSAKKNPRPFMCSIVYNYFTCAYCQQRIVLIQSTFTTVLCKFIEYFSYNLQP